MNPSAITKPIATIKVWTMGEMQRRMRPLHQIMDETQLDVVILTSIHTVTAAKAAA